MGDDDDEIVADVGEANRAFYRAFANGDLRAMEAVWSHGAHVRCVHPGWAMLEGWERVRESWSQILNGPDGSLSITVDDVQVRGADGVAWVVCIERLRAADLDTAMIATNVFELDHAGAWRMVQHHASPILTRDHERVEIESDAEREGPRGNDVN
jgi:ketosteroid isomerase-like protein